MLLIEVTDDHDLLTAAEIERALEVANNWGGWSFEEAELMARALQQTSGQSVVRVRVAGAGDGGGACAACQGDPESHGLHVCGKEPYA